MRPKVCHIFRIGRPIKFNLGIQMEHEEEEEDDDDDEDPYHITHKRHDLQG